MAGKAASASWLKYREEGHAQQNSNEMGSSENPELGAQHLPARHKIPYEVLGAFALAAGPHV